MKGNLSQQLLQKGITWEQLGLRQEAQVPSTSDDNNNKLKQSAATPTSEGQQSNNIKGFQAVSRKNNNNKNIISVNSQESSLENSKEQKKPIMLSNLLQHSKTSEVAAATRKGNLQSTQQAALLTPKTLKDNIKNDETSTKDVYPSKDESIAKKPQLYLRDTNHQTNIQIITDNNEENPHDHIESGRLTTTQSELKQQYYSNSSTKNSDSTPINPIQIYSSSPRAQNTVEKLWQPTDVSTDVNPSSSSSKNTSKQSSDRLFFLQLPKTKNSINQPASNCGSSAAKAENNINSCKVTKSYQQFSPSKPTQAKQESFAKERIYSFQQTRANTAHNTPQNLNKNGQLLKEYQDQEELFPSQPSYTSSSPNKYSQSLNSIEKHQQAPKFSSEISSLKYQPIKKQRNLTINQHSFSNMQQVQPVQHHHPINKSTKHSPSASAQFQQYDQYSNQIHTSAGLHQQQHSMEGNYLQQEQFERRMIAKTQFTCPTQPSLTSLQTFSIEQPHSSDYFSLSSSQQNLNSHHKNTGSSHKQNTISELPITIETTQKPTSQLFNQNYISKLTDFTPQGHQSLNNHQWKYDVSENLQPISNISAHKHANSNMVSVKQTTKPFDSHCLFSKKKTQNQSCMNIDSQYLMTRSEKHQTLEDFNECESESKIQLPLKINNFNNNETQVQSYNSVPQAQQKPFINIESPCSSLSQSSKKRGSYSNEILLSPPKNSKENQQQFERILSAIQTSGDPSLLSELTSLYSSIFVKSINLKEGNQKQIADADGQNDASNMNKIDVKSRKSSEQSDIQNNNNSGGYFSSNKKHTKYQSYNNETLEFNSNTPSKTNNAAGSTSKNPINDHNDKPKNNNTSTSSSSLEDKQTIQLAGINHKMSQQEEEEREEFLREEERIALSQTIILSQYIDFSKEEFAKIAKEFYASRNQTLPETQSLKESSVTVLELLELQKWMTAQLVDRLDEEKKARLKTEEQTSQMLLNQEKTIKVMESKWYSQLEQLQRTKNLSSSGKNADNQLLKIHNGTLPNFDAEDF